MYPMEERFESEDARLLALESEAVLLFLNPLLRHPEGGDYGTVPYQMYELSAWSSVPDTLARIETSITKIHRGYSYRCPTGLTGPRPDPEEEQKLKLALATSTFIPKTSWCKHGTKIISHHIADLLRGLTCHKLVTNAMNYPQTLNMIKGWIDSCSDEFRTRLIDIGNGTSRPPRLVMTHPWERVGKTDQNNRYIALSYCWGSGAVGSRVQAREDWEQESSEMASVYGGAWLTSQHPGEVRCMTGVIKIVPKHPGPVDSMEEPLYQYGWALQERILSNSVLICNRDQFVWECQDKCFTESGFRMEIIGAMRLDQSFYTNLKADRNIFRNIWKPIVTDYSHRHLTKPVDKPPAICGLAKQFQKISPEEVYLAGLWKTTPFDDLLWAHRTDDFEDEIALGTLNLRRQNQLPKREKPSGYGAPSWSWAFADGGVR
ncbi:hypothetical protein GQ44DRAFT_782296 [Phaeosphaeriaceae sp. PMI808]|nr:hypothetical protein GQ44DRAFT_782296 [Phaeosphaeriaceae sp. PMI808]